MRLLTRDWKNRAPLLTWSCSTPTASKNNFRYGHDGDGTRRDYESFGRKWEDEAMRRIWKSWHFGGVKSRGEVERKGRDGRCLTAWLLFIVHFNTDGLLSNFLYKNRHHHQVNNLPIQSSKLCLFLPTFHARYLRQAVSTSDSSCFSCYDKHTWRHHLRSEISIPRTHFILTACIIDDTNEKLNLMPESSLGAQRRDNNSPDSYINVSHKLP